MQIRPTPRPLKGTRYDRGEAWSAERGLPGRPAQVFIRYAEMGNATSMGRNQRARLIRGSVPEKSGRAVSSSARGHSPGSAGSKRRKKPRESKATQEQSAPKTRTPEPASRKPKQDPRPTAEARVLFETERLKVLASRFATIDVGTIPGKVESTLRVYSSHAEGLLRRKSSDERRALQSESRESLHLVKRRAADAIGARMDWLAWQEWPVAMGMHLAFGHSEEEEVLETLDELQHAARLIKWPDAQIDWDQRWGLYASPFAIRLCLLDWHCAIQAACNYR